MPDVCIPNLPAKEAGGSVVSYLKDLLRLSPAQLRGVGILLEKRLGAGTLVGSDEYRVPADQDLVVFQMSPSFRSTSWATEAALNAAVFTSMNPEQMERVRLNNVTVALTNKDRNLSVFDARAIKLGSLRDTPMYFPANAPLLVPATHTLKADFAVQDATAAVVGNDADYGLLLTGILIPKRV